MNIFWATLSAVIAILLLSTQAEAGECKDTTDPKSYDATYTWVEPTHREDETKLNKGEIKGQKLYITNTVTGVECTHWAGRDSSYSLRLESNVLYSAYITTTDTGNRESGASPVVLKGAKLKKPAKVEATFTRIGNTNEYTIDWEPVTTFHDGTKLTVDVSKYYFFVNGQWKRNVHVDQVPFTFKFNDGDNVIEFETEIGKAGYQLVSDRTDAVTLTYPPIDEPTVPDIEVPVIIPVIPDVPDVPETPEVPDVPEVTKPPTGLNYVIPEGYELIITIRPKQ